MSHKGTVVYLSHSSVSEDPGRGVDTIALLCHSQHGWIALLCKVSSCPAVSQGLPWCTQYKYGV